MNGIFENDDNKKSKLKSICNISKWNTLNAKYLGDYYEDISLFSSLNDYDINKIKKDIYKIGDMFNNCSLLESLPDISKWNINNIANMSDLFNNYSSLESLPDISKWNTNNITNISYLFFECSLLSSFPDISK